MLRSTRLGRLNLLQWLQRPTAADRQAFSKLNRIEVTASSDSDLALFNGSCEGFQSFIEWRLGIKRKIDPVGSQPARCRFIDFSSERDTAKAQSAHLNVGFS